MTGLFKRVPELSRVGVRGEISNINTSPNRTYFALKDNKAIVACSIMTYKLQRLAELVHGREIVAYGAVRVNEYRSQYYLDVEHFDIEGLGALHQEYEALKARFAAEGLFESSRKRPLPAYPRIIALISADGKGREDFERVIADRAPNMIVRFVRAQVQGVGADAEIADAFDRAQRTDAEVVVLARGGGSYEDLFTFNREAVVRAIVRCRIPVVTGIGHQTDRHLADDVADIACYTPTAAAEHFGRLWQRARETLSRAQVTLARETRHLVARAATRADMLDRALHAGVDRAIAARAQRLHHAERRLDAQRPGAQLVALRDRLASLDRRIEGARVALFAARDRALAARVVRLEPAVARVLANTRHRVQLLEGRLDAYDPNKAVAGGYAIISSNGRVVTDASTLERGDRIVARLAHGRLDAVVERVHQDE